MDWDISLKFRTHENDGQHSHAKRQASEEQDCRIREGTDSMSGAYTVRDFLECVSHSVSSLERSLRNGLSSPPITNEDVDNPDGEQLGNNSASKQA